MGSVAESVALHAHCSVLIVRAPAEETGQSSGALQPIEATPS
jgi:hypothetical protein